MPDRKDPDAENSQEQEVQSSHEHDDAAADPSAVDTAGDPVAPDVRSQREPRGDQVREPSEGGSDVAPPAEDSGQEDDLDGTGALIGTILEAAPVERRPQVADALSELTSHMMMMAASGSDWSGMLPPPDEFAKYPAHVQERMMRWNDAPTVDESARQDRLVDAQIELARNGPRWSFVVWVLAFAGAGVSAWGFDQVWLAGVFIASPVLGYAASHLYRPGSRSNGATKRSREIERAHGQADSTHTD